MEYKISETKIVIYKKVHAGAKTHAGGANGGFVSELYQIELNIFEFYGLQ